MTEGFEKYTHKLTKEEETVLVPLLIKGFSGKDKKNKITGKEIITKINSNLLKFNLTKKLTVARLNKCINHIRSSATLPIIGSSRGYYVSFDKDDIEKSIKSLSARQTGIQNAINGLSEIKRNKEWDNITIQ